MQNHINNHFTNYDRLVSKVFLLITLIFALFIAVASLRPTSTQPIIFSNDFKIEFVNILHIKHVFRLHDLRDITTNVLLYMPLGTFLSLAVSWPKPRIFSWWIFSGFTLSFIMECMQSFIGRVSDPIDLITNSIGFLLGFWIVVIIIRLYNFRPSVLLGLQMNKDDSTHINAVAALRFFYICTFFIVALLPFDISVSLTEIYEQIHPDIYNQQKIIIDPLYYFKTWPEGGTKLILLLLGLIPIAALTAIIDVFRRSLNIISCIYNCVVIAILSETIQLFVLSRTSDVILFPLSILAGIIGWGMVACWVKIQDDQIKIIEGRRESKIKLITFSLLSYCLFIFLISWIPFDFEYNFKYILTKIRYQSNLIPFASHLRQHDLKAAIDLVKEVGIYLPLGLLWALWFQQPCMKSVNRYLKKLLPAIFCGILAVFVELSQTIVISRYADFTDIILALIGGLTGSTLLTLFIKHNIKN